MLIVAGDITASHVTLEETLTVLKDTFAHVFYTPGNHDLWVKGALAGGVHIRAKPIDSIQKLAEVRRLCARLGVATEPAYAAGAIIAPLSAWYHSSFDTEPEIQGWEGIPPGKMVLNDFHLCSWPGERATRAEPPAPSLLSACSHLVACTSAAATAALWFRDAPVWLQTVPSSKTLCPASPAARPRSHVQCRSRRTTTRSRAASTR